MRRLVAPSRGLSCSRKAPAPSLSIQRRKSFSKAISGAFSSASTLLSISALKLPALSTGEGQSDPVATALLCSPPATVT